MVDQYGRPTFEDGYNIMRSAMLLKNFQNDQQQFAHTKKTWDQQAKADEYFNILSKGGSIPNDTNYDATAALDAHQRVLKSRQVENQQWQENLTSQVDKSKDKLATMPVQDFINYHPQNYGDMVAMHERLGILKQDSGIRQELDQLRDQKANESYKLALGALNEAKTAAASGDYNNAAQSLVRMASVTNNPFKVKPSGDGKTVELYYTKDGVDQPGQKMTIEQGIQFAQNFVQNGAEFFQSHVQNSIAKEKLNNDYVKNPVILQKGNEQIRAILQQDPKTNEIRWYTYDKNGNPISKDKPYVTDLKDMFSKGWSVYTPKSAEETRKNLEAITKVSKENREQQKFNLEKSGQWNPSGKQAGTGKFRNDWWPQTAEEKEGGDPNITEARAIVVKAYDTHKDPETQRLISNQIMPEYQKWVTENKDKMVTDPETGEQRPLNSQDLQSAFNHIAYNVIQKSKPDSQKTAGIQKTEAMSVKSSGKINGIELGVDKQGNIRVNTDGNWHAPKTDMEKQAVEQLKSGTLPRTPMKTG